MIRTLLIGVCAAFMATVSANAAIVLNITVDSAGNPLNGSGMATKAQYGQGNNNPGSNLAFLNNEISFWNAAFNPDLPAAVGAGGLVQGSLSGNSYTAFSGYDYVVFHFGNGTAGGSPGGWWQAWYLGGLGGAFSVPTVGCAPVGDFSSARYFNPVSVPPPAPPAVPDSGMTLALLGLGVIVLETLRRKMVTA